jgi:DNA-binding response OmpR family regulator
VHVLVVDDERDISDSVAAYLDMIGHRASAVYGGAAGASLLEKDHYDLLITDLDMPGVNGIDLVREVKRRHMNVRVIMMTGHRTMEALNMMKEAGVSDIIYKPFRFDELGAMVLGEGGVDPNPLKGIQ